MKTAEVKRPEASNLPDLDTSMVQGSNEGSQIVHWKKHNPSGFAAKSTAYDPQTQMWDPAKSGL